MTRTQHVSTVITGATGFVGGELLTKLLRESSRHLICPVRADSDLAAADRGARRLEELVGVGAADFSDRVEWVRSDIEERQLGWCDGRWHDIASRTAEIFHCAASVSFDLPLDQAQRINVDGTVNVFALAQAAVARHCNFTRFHHVSTAFVAGVTAGRVTADYLPNDKASTFRNTYERTKARAERFLRSAASHTVPVTIHRPSIIAGNSRTGATTNWNVLYVPMKMTARGALPAFHRGGRQLVDAVAVDFLVDAMVVFSQLDAKPLEAHNITAGPTAFTVTDVIESTIEAAAGREDFTPSATKLLGPLRWRALTAAIMLTTRLPKAAGQVRRKARVARRCLGQCAVYLSYSNVSTVFDASREHDLLRVFGVEMPRGDAYLDTILGYALDTNFGKTVTVATEVPVA